MSTPSTSGEVQRPPLSFETIFDQPVPLLPVPTDITGGQRPELQVVDRFTRGVAIVGRFALSPSLIGLKVDPGEADAIRVRLTLSTDKVAEEWWHKRPPEHVTRADTATGRLILLRSQARTRAAVYLAPPRDTHGETMRTVVEFDLEPGSVSSDGLLIFEAVDADVLPDWAQKRIMPYSQVGVRIDRIELTASEGAPAPLVPPYVGRQRDGFAPQLFVATPSPNGELEPIHVRVRRQYPRAEVNAVRAFNKVVRETRVRLRPESLPVMQGVLGGWIESGAVSLDGFGLETGAPVRAELTLRHTSDGDDSHAHADLTVLDAPADEPVLVRVSVDRSKVNVESVMGHKIAVWDALTD